MQCYIGSGKLDNSVFKDTSMKQRNSCSSSCPSEDYQGTHEDELAKPVAD